MCCVLSLDLGSVRILIIYAFLFFSSFAPDSYVINEDVNETGIAFFAIFDGHGGEYAAVFAKDVLVDNLINKMTEASNIAKGKVPSPSPTRANCSDENKDASPTGDTAVSKELTPDATVQRRTSFKKSLSTTDGTHVGVNSLQRESDNFLKKLNSIRQTKESLLQKASGNNAKPQQYEARCYIEKDGNITFGKMISDEILAADYKLIEMAKKEVSIINHSVDNLNHFPVSLSHRQM